MSGRSDPPSVVELVSLSGGGSNGRPHAPASRAHASEQLRVRLGSGVPISDLVDDDGPGIRPEERSDVFVLYTTSKRGGTGLGLPLAREDVRRHGGEIEVLARPGGGARFVVHLPPPGEGEPAGHEEEA